MDLRLAGRTYVVTGGSRGLGRAAADTLVAEGANVVVSSRSSRSVDEAVAALGERAVGVAADNAEPSTADALVAAAKERFGGLHGALISVGGPPAGPTLEISDEQWRDAFESVFLGAVRVARAVLAELADGGAVGFVLSTSVKAPIEGLAISNGLRPGLAMLAKTLADEVGPRGIRVFGLLPGRIATARTRELDGADPDAGARRAETIPLRRYGEPAEFGAVAAFLLSPVAAYVSGCVIPVDGGALRSL